MSQFSVDDEKIKKIAATFLVNEGTVTELHKKYSDLNSRMKDQFLAHVMRSLEEYIRENCNAPLFRITCRASTNNPAIRGTGCASYKEKLAFNIVYDSQMDQKQARVVIAHELGHLFALTVFNREYKDKHEPLSSIFGIFTILDKNDFYAEKTVPFQHKSWEDIISDFALLKNRAEGKENIS